jgi:hypothetical protein
MMPSEFKEKWENLTKEQLLDALPSEILESHDMLAATMESIFT